MFNLYILEDDENFKKKEKQLIHNILGECNYDQEISNKIDLYLLDIYGEVNGIELASKIKKHNQNAQIIFVTSYDALVYEAMRTFPFYFARKSHLEELEYALKEFLASQLVKTMKVPIANTREEMDLSICEIVAIEKYHNYCDIHTKNSTFHKRCSLKEIDQDLDDHFIYVNKGVIVNIDYMNKIDKDVLLDDFGQCYSISRSRRKDVIKMMIRKKVKK